MIVNKRTTNSSNSNNTFPQLTSDTTTSSSILSIGTNHSRSLAIWCGFPARCRRSRNTSYLFMLASSDIKYAPCKYNSLRKPQTR